MSKKSADPAQPPSKSPAEQQHSQQHDGGRVELQMRWEGPIPPPIFFKQLNDVVPNGGERMFAQFEAETRHRHKREANAQLYPLLDRLAARLGALLFSCGCLYVAYYSIGQQQPWPAIAFGAASIAIGVNAFLRSAPQRPQPPPSGTSQTRPRRR